MDYKEVIIKKRIRLGYSRNKLSQLIGISQPFIIEIEEGEKSHRWIAFGGSGRKISGFSGRRQFGNIMGDLRVSPSRSISAEVFVFFQELALPMAPIKKTSVFSVLPPAQGGGCVKGEPLRVPPSRSISAEVFAFFQELALPMAPIKKEPVGSFFIGADEGT